MKLNVIISNLKEKSGMDDVYNFDDVDKLFKYIQINILNI